MSLNYSQCIEDTLYQRDSNTNPKATSHNTKLVFNFDDQQCKIQLVLTFLLSQDVGLNTEAVVYHSPSTSYHPNQSSSLAFPILHRSSRERKHGHSLSSNHQNLRSIRAFSSSANKHPGKERHQFHYIYIVYIYIYTYTDVSYVLDAKGPTLNSIQLSSQNSENISSLVELKLLDFDLMCM